MFDVKALLAEARAKIGTTKHWHGGPSRCPVCGGIKPELESTVEPLADWRAGKVQADF